VDPISDIFRTMHITAFGQHRLEATAPWGLIQEKQTEEKVTPSGKRISSTDLAHFVMLSRGNCWLSVEGIPNPIPLIGDDFFLLARTPRSSCVIAREHVQGQPSARSLLKPTATSLITEAVAHQRQSYAAPSVSTEPT
jgi:hypothetical protein